MRPFLRLVGFVVVGLLVAGCSGGDPPSSEDDTGSRGATSSGGATSGSGTSKAQVLKSWYGGGEVTTTVHPIEIVDDHAVLSADFALDPEGEEFTLGYALEPDSSNKGSGGIRLVDLESDRAWMVGFDAEGTPTATGGRLGLRPGESIATVTMFAAPDVGQVDVLVPGVGLVRDVPVVEGDADTPTVASLELTGEVTFPEAARLSTYTQSYLDGVSASGQGKEQTVTLASDVLFDTDKYDLTADATKAVHEAATAIKSAASEGEVRVVGHTDDVLSQEYNQKLSVKRAQTVADRLAKDLGADFVIVAEGKGKSQPAVRGTTEEARAANRRVEITFSATKTAGFGSAIPEATVPVSTGNEPVEHVDQWERTFRVAVTKVVRRDGYLVGSLDVSIVKGEPYFPYRWFGYGHFDGPLAEGDQYGAWPVYLLTDAGKVFAAQYSTSRGEDEFFGFLADTLLVNKEVPLGRVFSYDVVWPDPGTDTISVEAREAFRITDIPVENE